MKINDTFPVTLNEWTVADAVVIDIEGDKVTLEIPATRVVMGVKTSLTDLTPKTPEVDRLLLDTPPEPEVKPTAPVESTVPSDAIGEGLANVVLREME